MVSVFDIIPNNFFNPLSSNSNYRTNAALLQFIYEQYDNEISYRIKRNILRDEVAYYISEHSEEFLSDNDMSNKSYQDISSDYLRRFASKEVGWLEEEFDETKANSLLKVHFYDEVMEFMIANNCKLEQEIISWLNERN